ncbi:hypothetical protein HU175_05050 [Spirosoma sp. KUDC1026]|nr:hypothetical protein HU175_05050 [Spirosoma sp. KUDC1026]
MNHKKSKVSSTYEASSTEVQTVIMDWVEATEAFHRRYAKLTEVINTLQSSTRVKSAQQRERLNKLTALRRNMSDVLMTLLVDMGDKQSGRSALPSKPGQLRTHASLLTELTQKIDAELVNATVVAQA